MIAYRLASSLKTSPQARHLSSQASVAVERLRNALEEYRASNYAQCMPSRFKKELLKAAKNDKNADIIALEGMQRVIANINMEHKVSRSDIETIFREVGEANDMMPAERFMKMI